MASVAHQMRSFDEAVDKWLEPRRSETLDHVFYGLSSAADHGLLWHAVGALRAARRHRPADALRFSAALGVEAAITNGLVKSLFGRLRPPDHFAHDDPLPYGMRRPITSSFPSGHAATAFMSATVLARSGRGAVAWGTVAALVSFSRVYVRMHHASDVAAGAVLGLALGVIARRVLR